ncbi:MAG: alpha/beta fold hydrolase, partial [Stackebrandtia sp.]
MAIPAKLQERFRARRSRDVRVADGRARPRRRRRRIVAAVFGVVAVLLAANTAAVEWDSAEAGGDSIVHLKGGDVHVAQDGPRDAPALVLIHGLAGSTHWWDKLVPKLTESHRVISIDLLGHGRSAKPTGSGYQIPEQARRVGAALDRLGVKQAIVAGHSTGGSVATALAEERGDLVTALALINTGPSLDAFASEGIAARAMFTPVLGHLVWRVRTDAMLRKAMSSAFTRRIEVPQQLVDDVDGMT